MNRTEFVFVAALGTMTDATLACSGDSLTVKRTPSSLARRASPASPSGRIVLAHDRRREKKRRSARRAPQDHPRR
jgi:hypothetical protein